MWKNKAYHVDKYEKQDCNGGIKRLVFTIIFVMSQIENFGYDATIYKVHSDKLYATFSLEIRSKFIGLSV